METLTEEFLTPISFEDIKDDMFVIAMSKKDYHSIMAVGNVNNLQSRFNYALLFTEGRTAYYADTMAQRYMYDFYVADPQNENMKDFILDTSRKVTQLPIPSSAKLLFNERYKIGI